MNSPYNDEVPIPHASHAPQPGAKNCPFCGSFIPQDAVVCTACGRQVQTLQTAPQMKFCQHCGASIPAQAVICTSCGGQVQQFQQVPPTHTVPQQQVIINNVPGGVKPRSKWTAFFLCLFLGYFGVHKFYEGKTGMGLLYLFTGGLCGFGWIIDIIALLFKSDPYYP